MIRDGQLVDQDDGYPLRGSIPLLVMGVRIRVIVRPDVTLTCRPVGGQPGTYQVIGAGVFTIRLQGSECRRLEPDGRPLPDDVAILVNIERP